MRHGNMERHTVARRDPGMETCLFSSLLVVSSGLVIRPCMWKCIRASRGNLRAFTGARSDCESWSFIFLEKKAFFIARGAD